MKLRRLAARDADALHALESSINAFPWSRHQFDDSFDSGHFGWGYDQERQLQGFALFSQTLDEATLLNIAMHPGVRRRGLARSLLVYALRELEQRGVLRCLLEVRVSNEPAIALYRSLGFSADGWRRNYYPSANGREDALLMSRNLPYQTVESA